MLRNVDYFHTIPRSLVAIYWPWETMVLILVVFSVKGLWCVISNREFSPLVLMENPPSLTLWAFFKESPVISTLINQA